MLEQTKRIPVPYHSEFLLNYLRWSRSQEPDLPTGSGSDWLRNTGGKKLNINKVKM